MTGLLLATGVLVFGISHMLFGAGEALNHGVWHWLPRREMPRFIVAGQVLHMKHHRKPGDLDYIVFPAWGHLALLRGIVQISLVMNIFTALMFGLLVPISWTDAIVTYIVLSTAAAAGMASYMWFYGVVHRSTHTKWSPQHPLYATRHMWHHVPGCWNHSAGMAILPIYGWAMWLKPVVMWGIRAWKRIEDARSTSADPADPKEDS